MAGSLPYLNLPIRVGIAFVPSVNSQDISAAEKQDLLMIDTAVFDVTTARHTQ